MTSRPIEVDGRDHAVDVRGNGSPTVVLEPAIGDVGLTWGLVLPAVAEFATAFTHDRPGLGDSEPADRPRTVEVMVDELRAALTASGLSPPYVVVGHSFSSLTVQAFARRYPDEVHGVVFVDGAHEDQMERFPAELNPRPMLTAFASQLRELARAARRGEEVAPLVPPPTAFPTDVAEAYRAATSPTATRLETTAAEFEALQESQAQVRRPGAGSLGDVPLLALRHGLPQPMPGVTDDVNERYEAVWQELQAELAARSTRGRVVVADRAGHMIHHDRPDLVVEAIRETSAET